jgi:hypothetical protein
LGKPIQLRRPVTGMSRAASGNNLQARFAPPVVAIGERTSDDAHTPIFLAVHKDFSLTSTASGIKGLRFESVALTVHK